MSEPTPVPAAPPRPTRWSRFANSRVGIFVAGGGLVAGTAAATAPFAYDSGFTDGQQSGQVVTNILNDSQRATQLQAFVASQMAKAVKKGKQFDAQEKKYLLAAISPSAVTMSAESNRVFYVHLDTLPDGAAISYSPIDGVNQLPNGAIRAADGAWQGKYGAAVSVSDAGIRTSFGNGTGYLVLPNGAGPDREKATFISAPTSSHSNAPTLGITSP